MTSHAQAFDAREDGSFRISLTYDSPTGAGKTTTHTGTFHGRFVKLVTNEQVVEQIRAVDRIRLIKWLGTIDEQTLDRVDEAIKISRGIIRL